VRYDLHAKRVRDDARLINRSSAGLGGSVHRLRVARRNIVDELNRVPLAWVVGIRAPPSDPRRPASALQYFAVPVFGLDHDQTDRHWSLPRRHTHPVGEALAYSLLGHTPRKNAAGDANAAPLASRPSTVALVGRAPGLYPSPNRESPAPTPRLFNRLRRLARTPAARPSRAHGPPGRPS
jgi:hypothetical protein